MDQVLVDPFQYVPEENENHENLPVYLRIKPLKDEAELSVKVIDSTTVETNHVGRANKKAKFSHVFCGSVCQQEVFDVTTAPLVQKFLDGANVMTFAYGVTSSGKTFTIMGSHANPGLVPRTLEKIFSYYQSKIKNSKLSYKPTLFDNVQELKASEVSELRRIKTLLLKAKTSKPGFSQYALQASNKSGSDNGHTTIVSPAFFCSVWISVYEIYNEIITDLLQGDIRGKRKALTVGQDPKGRTFVKELTQIPVTSAAEAYGLLQIAKQNLAKAVTKLNDSSSRSHMIFNIKMVHWGGALSEPLVNHFVISDLAGCERQAKTGTSGVTLKQASAINNSLLVLGRCLEALRKKDKGIAAPFRDSKLTRMLNPFFTLGGYVSLIICVNPQMKLQDETMDTIRFSAIASEIVQDPIEPLERLRKLRRMTQNYFENNGNPVEEDSEEVNSWKEAVNGVSIHDGVRFIEVKTSYFNDMARDILRAEKLLVANEEEIEQLKTRLKEAELSRENIHYMYQDKMKEQREKFAKYKAEIHEIHLAEKKNLIETYEEEIDVFKQKYNKYRSGYAKMSDYLKEKLWPEVNLFRERFGFLPEFPQKNASPDEDCVNPENSIAFWQSKLNAAEQEIRDLKKELVQKTDSSKLLEEILDEAKCQLAESQTETEKSLQLAKDRSIRITELETEVRKLTVALDDLEPLHKQISDLQKSLQASEEARETIETEFRVQIDVLNEDLQKTRNELKNKVCEELPVITEDPAESSTEPDIADDLQTELIALRAQSEQAQSEVSVLRAQIENMTMQEKKDELQTEVEMATEEHKTVVQQDQIDEIAQLREKLAESEAKTALIERLTEENTTLRQRFEALQNKSNMLECEVKHSEVLLRNKLDPSVGYCFDKSPPNNSINEQPTLIADKTEIKPRRRRFLLESDENSFLDKTLQETIRDPSPIANFRRAVVKSSRRK